MFPQSFQMVDMMDFCGGSQFMILTQLIAMLSFGQLASAIYTHLSKGESCMKADVLFQTVRALSLMYSILLMYLIRRAGTVTSGFLLVFWILEFITKISPLYQHVLLTDKMSTFVWSLFHADLALTTIMLILNCFAELRYETQFAKRKAPPEMSASFLSRITFSYCFLLLRLGLKRPIVEDDLWDLRQDLKCEAVTPRLQRFWLKTLASFKERKKRQASLHSSANEDGAATKSLTEFYTLSNDKDYASITLPIVKTFLCEALGTQVIVAGNLFFTLLQPVLMRVLLGQIARPFSPEGYIWRAYTMALFFAIFVILTSLTQQNQIINGCRIGIRLQSALISIIYRKVLTTFNLGRCESSISDIIELVSSDTEQLLNVSLYFWHVWTTPVEIAVLTYMLFWTMGESVFAGIGTIITLMVVNSAILRKISTNHELLTSLKNERVKMMSEVITEIKALKLYAWEGAFEHEIKKIRRCELLVLHKINRLTAISSAIVAINPFLVCLTTFGTYSFLLPQDYLWPVDAFVTIALFNMLRHSLSDFPLVITELASARTALARISRFLSHCDIDTDNVTHYTLDEDNPTNNICEGTAVCIEDGNFQWDSSTGTCLKGINLRVQRGQLIAVVGQVDSGKSSLISAILGDMDKRSGRVVVKGRVAYLPDEPWIQNTTVRENILFGRLYDDKRYKRVLKACALTADLDLLPVSDLTEIGEKGINLTEAQKQKVSLARAVYNDADVYLLDNPLGAIDVSVAQHIFEKVISKFGLLGNKTRVLVTHTMHWLQLVDQVIVMDNGQISERGSYQTLRENSGSFRQFVSAESIDHDIQWRGKFHGQRTASLASNWSVRSRREFSAHAIHDVKKLAQRKSLIIPQAMGNKESVDRWRTPYARASSDHALLKMGMPSHHVSHAWESHNMSSIVRAKIRIAQMDVSSSACGTSGNVDPVEKWKSLLSKLKKELCDAQNKYKIGRQSAHSSQLNESNKAAVKNWRMLQMKVERELKQARDREMSINSIKDSAPKTTLASDNRPKHEEIMDVEQAETIQAKSSVYAVYLSAVGPMPMIIYTLMYIVYGVVAVAANIWLSRWTDDHRTHYLEIIRPNHTFNLSYRTSKEFHIEIYGCYGFFQVVLVLTSLLGMARLFVLASRRFHDNMLRTVLRCGMSYFDKTPAGGIINRFTSDIDAIDEAIPEIVGMAIDSTLAVVSTFFVLSYAMPIFVPAICPLFIAFFIIQKLYLKTSGPLQRLQASTKSPIISHISESLHGTAVIRSYNMQEYYIQACEEKTDRNHMCYYYSVITSRWLGFCLNMLGNIVFLIVALVAVWSSEKMKTTPGLVGLCLCYAMELTGALTWVIKMMSELEANVTSAESIVDYSHLVGEAEWSTSNGPPTDWPSNGQIVFDQYTCRYRPDLDLALKGVSVSIGPREKIAIVGRSGAGKTTMVLALFRIIEAAGGSIKIDSKDIADMGLHQLRAKLFILSQDPVLFSRTLRMNLDPMKKYSNAEIWRVLEQTHMTSFVKSLPNCLEYECSGKGGCFSVGQKQLICLARSLLRKTKILILDEATAAVDMETEALIQETIKSEFSHCTILTITQRLRNIHEYDNVEYCCRVMVLDNGMVIQYDTPETLMADKQGPFYNMGISSDLIELYHQSTENCDTVNTSNIGPTRAQSISTSTSTRTDSTIRSTVD